MTRFTLFKKLQLGFTLGLLLIVLVYFQNCSNINSSESQDSFASIEDRSVIAAAHSGPLGDGPLLDGTTVRSIPFPTTTTNVSSATSQNAICIRSIAPIAESFRSMLGRNPDFEEAQIYTEMMLEGTQLAYFEPYIGQENPSVNSTSTNPCYQFGGNTPYSDNAGIAFNTTLLSTGKTNLSEWTEKLANFSQFISIQYQTYQCRLPTRLEYATWVKHYSDRKNAGEEFLTIYKDIKLQIESIPQPTSAPCFNALNDITRRIWNRVVKKENLTSCDLKGPKPTDKNSDCYFAWGLVNNFEPWQMVDIIHDSRSTVGGIARNEPEGCYSQIDPQKPVGAFTIYNPHAIGEYISQVYRILLGRAPTNQEIEDRIKSLGYFGGNTRLALKNLVASITSSANPNSEYMTSTIPCRFEVGNLRNLNIYTTDPNQPLKVIASISRASAQTACSSYASSNATTPYIKCKWGHIVLFEKITAKCDSVRNKCLAGRFQDQTDTSSESIWSCLGNDGGSNATCKLAMTEPLADYIIRGAKLARGTSATRAQAQKACDDISLITPVDQSLECIWGTTILFQRFNGLCSLIEKNGCTKGTFSDLTDSTSQFKWACLGVGGGQSATCSMDIGPTDIYKVYLGPSNLSYSSSPQTFYNVTEKVALLDCQTRAKATLTKAIKCFWGTKQIFEKFDGLCSPVQVETCASGTYLNQADTASTYNWSCGAAGGGVPMTCTVDSGPLDSYSIYANSSTTPFNSYSKTTEKLALADCNAKMLQIATTVPLKCVWGTKVIANRYNGICGTTTNICSMGKLLDDPDTTTTYNWTCSGAGGGSSKSCSTPK